MTHRRPVRTESNRTRSSVRSSVLATVFVVTAALVGITATKIFGVPGEAGFRAPNWPVVGIGSDQSTGEDPAARPGDTVGHDPQSRKERRDSADEAGQVRDGVTVFNDGVPAVAKLDPALLGALRSAASDAAGEGIEFYVNSGWRSTDYQQQLLREAVDKYGSVEEASRWVAPPDKSEHVSGDAVDLGPSTATDWLAENGPAYGLCQIYQNEPWHFELRPAAVEQGCPPMYADPTHDPRLR